MSDHRLIVITGPPGAGKTTVAHLVAARVEPPVCVMESDWWWTTIVQGHIPPWEAAAHSQNRTVVRSFSSAASVMAAEGFTTILEGIVGPWMIDIVQVEAAARGVSLDYVVLRPTLEIVLMRAEGRAGDERVPGHPALTDAAVIEQLWNQFASLGEHEPHVLDTSELDAETTAGQVQAMLATGRHRMQPRRKQ